MAKKLIYATMIFVIFIGVMAGSNSCKQPDPPKAVVKVIDERGEPVPDAMVIVKPPKVTDPGYVGTTSVVYLENETKAIADTQWSSAEGKTFYNFKYKTIYRVEVTKDKDRQNPVVRRGVGALVLEEGKTIEITVTVNEQTVF
ncbi:hypothetical protein LJC11_00515 [Bacteroidales bacterium OttesenSCG-928-I21]|nr:hypothetical protein [Bacteroidales bacterium OttesenSCG-928-I21]